tara:strand:- start:70 stop:600 length:531 start_codon:yes stop_codon:yes gene_type:complete
VTKIINSNIEEVKIIEPSVFEDTRGYFFESYNQKKWIELGLGVKFIQDNESKSDLGVLRGIHFQKAPYEQSKLVRVIKGKIQDIAVDLRPLSKTYKKYFSIILDDKNKKQLFVPKGFGHAFLTLSNEAIVSYKVDTYYNPKSDSGIKFNDPELNISWELSNDKIKQSAKDAKLAYL